MCYCRESVLLAGLFGETRSFHGFQFSRFSLYTVGNAFFRLKRPSFVLDMHTLPIKGNEWNFVLNYVGMTFNNFMPIFAEMMNAKSKFQL